MKKTEHDGPRNSIVSHYLARFCLWCLGWKVEGKVPGKKCILLGAPHTSNWDFIYTLGVTGAFRLKISWMGKDSLFKGLFGWIMKLTGGIAVDRSSPNGVVGQMVEKFKESEKLVLTIAPAGTRKKRDHWRSGFYWIAVKAQIPLLCGFLDYKKKIGGFGLSFIPTGNIKEDMDKIREFYKDMEGKYPELKSDIRLLDEEKMSS